MDLAQQQPFSFPLLKNSEILQAMSELGVELTQAELTEPNRHKDRIRDLFVALVEYGLGLTDNDLASRPSAVLQKKQSLEHPELHDESLSEMKLLKATMKLMKICGLRDFGWKDLHAPTAKRLRRQLSGAVNFIKYREDKYETYAELIEQREELFGGLNEVNADAAELNERLEVVRVASNNKCHVLGEVEKECIEIETEIAQQNKHQASIRQESNELKKKANELKDKVAHSMLALEEALAEERKLASQVVQSPERIKREMSEAAKSLEAEKKECANAEQQAQFAKTKIATVVSAENDIVQAVALMEEAHKEKSKFHNVSEEHGRVQEHVADNQKKASALSEKREDYERQLHRVEEKIIHGRKQSKIKMDAAHDSLESAQNELFVVEKDRKDGMARVEASEAEVRSIEVLIEDDREKTDAEIANMIASFRKLEASVMKRNDAVMTAIPTL